MTKLQAPGSASEAWEEIDCILCGRDTQTRVVWPDEERGHIVRCGECGLCYRNPRRREEDLLRHFEEKWTEGIQSFLLEEYRQENLRRLAHWILRAHPGPGAILDVGSSYGNLLAQFPETWRRVGVEPSQKACRISQERLPGAEIIKGVLGSAPLPERAFDVIAMVDTIYYLPHPLRDLTRLAGFLKPGGTMFLEAPNFANRGQVYRWLGHSFEDTWMYFYTPVTLGKILKKVGLQMVARLDLPGHRVGSGNPGARLITRAEFALLKALRKLSGGRIDLAPHFVLGAQVEALRGENLN